MKMDLWFGLFQGSQYEENVTEIHTLFFHTYQLTYLICIKKELYIQ